MNEKLQKREESDHLNREKLLVSVQARNVALELDLKAKERQVGRGLNAHGLQRFKLLTAEQAPARLGRTTNQV